MLRKLEGFKFASITENLLMVDQVLSSWHFYEQGLVKVVRNDASYTLNSPSEYVEQMDHPIKIEGYERLNEIMHRECKCLSAWFKHFGHVSCHLFLSPKDSKSFSMHTDPDDVVVHMVKGRKLFESPEGTMTLEAGESIVIPRNHPHRAINVEDSIMLSFGLELFLESKL